mgnify:CR=1 FL=1
MQKKPAPKKSLRQAAIDAIKTSTVEFEDVVKLCAKMAKHPTKDEVVLTRRAKDLLKIVSQHTGKQVETNKAGKLVFA